ncbi:MAG: hypothetical protein Q9159_006381 [Coniocarpon cinnabarinum]
MGACSSCLNPNRHDEADDSSAQGPDREREPLLSGNEGSARHGVDAIPPEIAAARGAVVPLDPEAQKRERGEMVRICQGLAGHLMDVSGPSKRSSTKRQVEGAATSKASPTQPPDPDFSTLFDATFVYPAWMGTPPDRKNMLHTRDDAIPTVEENVEESSDAAKDLEQPLEEEQANLVAQKKWLQDIFDADPVERRWDWTAVRDIDGPLAVSFDDF